MKVFLLRGNILGDVHQIYRSKALDTDTPWENQVNLYDDIVHDVLDRFFLYNLYHLCTVKPCDVDEQDVVHLPVFDTDRWNDICEKIHRYVP